MTWECCVCGASGQGVAEALAHQVDEHGGRLHHWESKHGENS